MKLTVASSLQPDCRDRESNTHEPNEVAVGTVKRAVIVAAIFHHVN
jgi:hypothetical protein